MQTNNYDFTGRFPKMNGKRMMRWDLLTEVDRLAHENYRLVWGHSLWLTTHYDHLTCGELVVELKQLIKRNEELTK